MEIVDAILSFNPYYRVECWEFSCETFGIQNDTWSYTALCTWLQNSYSKCARQFLQNFKYLCCFKPLSFSCIGCWKCENDFGMKPTGE